MADTQRFAGLWPVACCFPPLGLGHVNQGSETMDEEKNIDDHATEEIIAAFDRERAEAKELHRRHGEQVRASRANDRPVTDDRKRRT